MKRYSPDVPPDADEWLDLDEQERIHLVEDWHRKAREKLPNHTAHALFHVVVENQIAEGMESVVRAMARLMKQGLDRHDAVHAVGSCLADHFFEVANSEDENDESVSDVSYDAAVERLNAEEWLRKYE